MLLLLIIKQVNITPRVTPRVCNNKILSIEATVGSCELQYNKMFQVQTVETTFIVIENLCLWKMQVMLPNKQEFKKIFSISYLV